MVLLNSLTPSASLTVDFGITATFFPQLQWYSYYSHPRAAYCIKSCKFTSVWSSVTRLYFSLCM